MFPSKLIFSEENMNFSLPLKLCSIEYHKQSPVSYENGLNVCQLIIGLKGRGVFRIHGQKEFVLNEEQCVIIKPEVTHEYQAVDEEDWETLTIRFDCSAMIFLQFSLRTHNPLELQSPIRVMQLIEQFWRQGAEEDGAAIKTSELIYSLLLEIKLQSTCLQKEVCNRTPAMSKQIMDYIHKHYSQKLTVNDLCKKFGYTQQHLNRIFKKEVGYSVYQYILKTQLQHAAEMLENKEMTVEKVVDEVGMECRSFYRLFQREYSLSPGEYRRRAAMDGK